MLSFDKIAESVLSVVRWVYADLIWLVRCDKWY